MSIIRVKARVLLGAAAIADGVDVLRQPAPHEQVAAPLVEALNRAADQEFAVGQVVRASAVTQVVAGGLIASSLAPRLGAVASLAATLPAALFGYRFWEMDDADQRARARRGFFAHIALVGAALLILSSPVGRRRRDEAGGQRRRPARCGRRAKAAKAAQTA